MNLLELSLQTTNLDLNQTITVFEDWLMQGVDFSLMKDKPYWSGKSLAFVAAYLNELADWFGVEPPVWTNDGDTVLFEEWKLNAFVENSQASSFFFLEKNITHSVNPTRKRRLALNQI